MVSVDVKHHVYLLTYLSVVCTISVTKVLFSKYPALTPVVQVTTGVKTKGLRMQSHERFPHLVLRYLTEGVRGCYCSVDMSL